MRIKIFYDEVKYRLRQSNKTKSLIMKVIREEKLLTGDLKFIITNDKNLKEINLQFLKHNYYTDVIAFDYSEGKNINGEVYISFDTVRRNAINYKVSLKKEIIRVMIHGTLHLCGYDDKTKRKRKIMKNKEEKWLSLGNEK